MNRFAFAIPGSLETPTGGYAYDRRIIAELRQAGWRIDVLDLGPGFPFPSSAQRAAARARFAGVPAGCPLVIDGLAFGAMPEDAFLLRRSHPLIALVHHPLALETGLSAEQSDLLRASERLALACARQVVATSTTTAALLAADFEVPAARITVARPGCTRIAPAAGGGEGPVRLLSVGSVVPRKGHDVLIAALARLVDLPWRLTIAGDVSRDPHAAAALAARIAQLELGERITLLGAVPEAELPALYAAADVFALASRYEGYGMALADAVAHGVPVVATAAGAIPETVPRGAGILVPVDDVAALAAALRRVIADTAERARLAAAARAAAPQLPTWEAAAQAFAQAVAAAR